MTKPNHCGDGVMPIGRLPGTSAVDLTKDEAAVLRRLLDKQLNRRPRAATPIPLADPSILVQKVR